VKYKSVIGKTIELTNERKNYFLVRHAGLRYHFSKVKSVLTEPDEIRYSKRDNKVLLFYKFFDKILSGKYIAVVVRVNRRSFIITAYITDKVKIGKKYEQTKN